MHAKNAREQRLSIYTCKCARANNLQQRYTRASLYVDGFIKCTCHARTEHQNHTHTHDNLLLTVASRLPLAIRERGVHDLGDLPLVAKPHPVALPRGGASLAVRAMPDVGGLAGLWVRLERCMSVSCNC